MALKLEKWGWKHVNVLGEFERGSGSKKWKCKHCHELYNGSYSRVRAHLLGFVGSGIKPCPAIDAFSREPFRLLDQEDRKMMHKKKRRIILSGNNSNNLRRLMRTDRSKGDTDNIVARFFFADGLSLDVVNSSFFHEMNRLIGAFGSGYEPPSIDCLSGSLLTKEKVRIEKALGLAKESWSHTGCTIFCGNRLDGSVGCFCVDFFVASPRGVNFLKEADIIEGEGDGPDNEFIKELADVIIEVGPTNVVQVITHISGQTSDAFESILLSKFPHIFWSHCSSHSILFLMEEIAQLDWTKSVVSSCKKLDQCIDILKEEDPLDLVSQKFAPSYGLVKRVINKKSAFHELLASHNWKEQKSDVETIISSDDFWCNANLMLHVCEPFVRLLASFDVDKSVMGDIYNWRITSLESLKSNKKVDKLIFDQLEMVIESKWDKLFSPLHGAAYMLNPKYFGKYQCKDDGVLMKSWDATLERYEIDIEARRVLGDELGYYQRGEGCFGEVDAIECRDQMESVSWWENFGFETPRLQNLAVKILSQISSAEITCRCEKMTCKDDVQKLGLAAERAKDFVFVRNNLRLQSLKK